jgi:ribosomal protein L18
VQFALPDLAAVVAAGFLLLLACAILLLAALLANTLGHAPVIGGWIRRDLAGWLRDGGNAVLGAAKATWHFAAGLFNWAQDILTKPLIYAYNWAVSAWKWLNVLFTQTLPDLENRVTADIVSAYDRAERDTAAAFSAAERDAARLAVAAERDAAQLARRAENYAAGLVSAAEKSLTAAILNAEHAAATGITEAERALQAGISAVASGASADLAALAGQVNTTAGELARDIVAETQAAEAVAAAQLAAVRAGIYTDLTTWGNQAVTEAWPDASGDIAALRRALGGDFPWLNDLAGALGGLGAAGLAGALIRSIAGTQAITRLAADCIVPNCRNLSGLGNDLQQLLGDASIAAMIAWLIFGVTDPAGWASETYDAAGRPLTAVVSGVSHLVGGP